MWKYARFIWNNLYKNRATHTLTHMHRHTHTNTHRHTVPKAIRAATTAAGNAQTHTHTHRHTVPKAIRAATTAAGNEHWHNADFSSLYQIPPLVIFCMFPGSTFSISQTVCTFPNHSPSILKHNRTISIFQHSDYILYSKPLSPFHRRHLIIQF